MTEYENQAHQDAKPEPLLEVQVNESPAKNIGVSIIVGAILISASIFYNFNLLINTLNGGSLTQKPANLNAQGSAAAPQQQPADPNSGNFSVSSRVGQPTMGNKNAKVTVVEFGDFQCPFCQKFFNDTLGQIKSAYIDTGKIQYVFRHFPLTQIHQNAEVSSVAAECANQQGKFWEYHDLLYKNGKGDGTNLDKASLEKYGDLLGLNAGTLGFGKNKFNQCVENNSTLKVVQDDQAEGSKNGVSGTPTFFINGQKLVGAQPFANFQKAIDEALK